MRTAHHATFFDGVDLQKAISGRETDHEHVLNVLRPLIDSVDALADVPYPILYPLLVREYPNAKYILLHRDPGEWAMSVRSHIGRREFDEFERAQYWNYFPTRPRHLHDISTFQLMRMHVQHTKNVTDFFGGFDAPKVLIAPLSSPKTAVAISQFLFNNGEKFVFPHIGQKKKRQNSK
jgi:hypothetical protein